MLHFATQLTSFVTRRLAGLLLPLESEFSIASLVSALCVATVYIVLTRRPGKRAFNFRVIMRALFPSWLYRNPSFRVDVFLLLANALAFSTLIGWASVSSAFISRKIAVSATSAFGPVAGPGLQGLPGAAVVTIFIFIAYELGYWIDHYLSHRVPLLWEFHKVHHTAEVLSPLTNFRVHPVDSIVFANIVGVSIGVTEGVLGFMKIGTQPGVTVNLLAVAFMWTLGHLQHSHIWIATTGLLGRVILSPAHHQIHHSENPKHFNKNFGSFISTWDWMFGTLHMPTGRREHLSFGVGEPASQEHTLVGSILMPFVSAWKAVRHN